VVPENNFNFIETTGVMASNQPENDNLPQILVVEDNADMRNYITSNLEKKFRVVEAENGAIGLSLATRYIPDLIVSDVLMPEMDGIKLCRHLKTNILTSHIPVVLLTALSQVSNQIEGLETGADDYISKPFNYKLFEIRIENLINMRRKLRERFAKEPGLDSKDFTLNTRDQEFLDKTIALIKEQIADPELNVDTLSKALAMSRMHLHRKITALTNLPPAEFIRSIRLKEAARLLAERKYNISEIAYQVGISPSYFSVMFSRQFGVSPTEYIEKAG
jgi:DNA-binding response OmpR family regulator